MAIKANHICKYSKCRLGVDPEGAPCPKAYYACDYCDHINHWHSAACCIEHYELYVREVLDARAKGQTVSLLPNRIDQTEAQTEKLLKKTAPEVLEQSKIALSEYLNEDGCVFGAVEQINMEIDLQNQKRKKGKNA